MDFQGDANKAYLMIKIEELEAINFKKGLRRLNVNYKTEEK